MIDFSLLPKVAYEEMNRVHGEEVELLNRLEHSLQNSPDDAGGINVILDELTEHTREHFSNEEKLMLEVGFPAYTMHKSEHDRIIKEMHSVMMQWRRKKEAALLREYFLQTLPVWLEQHIASMDTITAQFICMRKGC